MKSSLIMSRLSFALTWSLAIWALALFWCSPSSAVWFEIAMTTSEPGEMQLFWDPSGGAVASEANSARTTAVAADDAATYRFALPVGRFRTFRFDPTNRDARIRISSAQIVRRGSWGWGREVLARISPQQFRGLHQIASLAFVGGSIDVATVADANDPSLQLELGEAVSVAQAGATESVEATVALALLVAFAWLCEPHTRGVRGRMTRTFAGGWRVIAGYAAPHPRRTVWVVAAVGVALSCFPVIFQGRSFVAPDNGAPLFYERPPYVPGYVSAGAEDPEGTDVGALMWQSVPYAVIQNRALRSGELPLWNRYNSSGTALLGQGISMLGDPLGLAVVLLGANGWAWDMKFLAAKLLFATGVGLTVLLCTRHNAAALLVALSASFVGLFNYRVNHPAIFAFAYSPWILYCWLRVVQAPESEAYLQVRWLLGLVVSNWMVLTSGTVKEAYMLLAFLNLTGGCVLLLDRERWDSKVRKLGRVIMSQLAFVMLSAPMWVTFLETLGRSFSTYDVPSARQISPSLFIGLFDDIFYREMNAGELKAYPAANFLVLFGCLWAVAKGRSLAADRRFVGIAIGAGLSIALAFGVVPEGFIVRVPFLANVIHVGNTFSVVAIVHLLVLAGYGVQACMGRISRRQWLGHLTFAAALLGAMLFVYLDRAQGVSKTSFFAAYATSLIAGVLLLPVLLRPIARGTAGPVVALLLLLTVAVLHWRYGMYTNTSVNPYVMNPQVRADFDVRSGALDLLNRSRFRPSRVVGFDNVLFPGFQGALGVESFYGCDPLQNRFYRELIQPTITAWDWRSVVTRDSLERFRGLYDLLNISYYLDSPSAGKPSPAGLQRVGELDLDVYESRTAWPRAFFVNHLTAYESATEFRELVLSARRGPFAAVQRSELSQSPFLRQLADSPAAATAIPATNYKLTNNTTRFVVDAPGPGLAVLTEVYSDGDFVATLNGKRVPIERVNHAFKGIAITEPGAYTVTISYWPERFSLLLMLSAAGTLLLAAWALRFGRRPAVQAST